MEQALTALLAAGAPVTADATKVKCKHTAAVASPVPALEVPVVNLTAYDLLLEVATQ